MGFPSFKKKLTNKVKKSMALSSNHWRVGSPMWFVRKELQYGGISMGVPVRTASKLEPPGGENERGHTGGDRMLYHEYADAYAKYLEPFYRSDRPIVLLEIGILKGVGLATWCDLFPTSRIIGLDIDLSYFKDNEPFLRSRGAFKSKTPELYSFDQFENNIERLKQVLRGDNVDVVIDDGHHSDQSILQTIESVRPYLSFEFSYFIEDNNSVYRQVKREFPNSQCFSQGELTIVTSHAGTI